MPRRPHPGLRVAAAAATAVATVVAYVVLTSQWAHDPEDAGVAGTPPPAPSSPATVPTVPAQPPAVRTPTLGVSTPTLADLERFIAVTGTTPEVFDVFESWSRDRPLDRAVADAVAALGSRLSITWEPWDADVDVDRAHQPDYALATITGGEHDAYIDTYARSIAEYGHPVTVRLMHEMNGNWYPWSTGVNGNRDGDFVLAWRYVHDRFAALGVTNVEWMWAPNAVYPGARALAPLYPGDAYVDAVGVSNYNWGDDRRDGYDTVWSGFGELFDQSFAEVRAITAKPLWVSETGSSDRGGSKAEWLAAMLVEVAARPDIAGVIWFDHVDRGRGVDWRIEDDAEAVAAWTAAFTTRPVLAGPPA